MSNCSKCKNLILEPHTTYGINPLAVCRCATMTTPEDTELLNFMDSLDWVYGRYDDQMWHKFQSNKENTMSQESALEFMNLITLHTQRAETKARINEHSELWDIVPSFAEHVGTVKEISELRVFKLEAQLTNPTEAGEL